METPTTTKMMKPDEVIHKTKMVKVKALRPFMVDDRVITEGQTVEVPEARADELCDKIFKGAMAFTGERYIEDGEVHVFKIKNAVRV